jgi:hypothetical protein
MKVDYAFLMSDEDLSDYYNQIKSLYNTRRIEAIQKLEVHAIILIKGYESYEENCILNFYSEKKQLYKQISFYKERKCITCGSTLRYITHEWGNFYGCPNYRDEREHTKFSIIQEQSIQDRFDNLRVRIDINWLTDILKSLSLNKQIRASELLDFYTYNGLEDLREKYGYKNTKSQIFSYHIANTKAKKEEKEIQTYMSSFFDKMDVQRGIRYKLENEKEKVGIIDLIIPYKDIIYLIEIKRHVHDIKVDQLQLYYTILSHIVRKHDTRIIRPLFLVYNNSEYSQYYRPANFTFFDDIKFAQHAVNIILKLELGVSSFKEGKGQGLSDNSNE